ncbi:MAG: GNAT family N-acetyltransferase, partial [Bacteroidaceae bacterium]|nr:GNAT family N-acetyltransferase [Bacteroidaceae bacterium]
MDIPILQGERIYLRRLTEDDVSDDYVRWMNDPEINQYLESRFHTHTIESTRAFIRSETNENKYQFGIFVKETGKHIGNIKIG